MTLFDIFRNVLLRPTRRLQPVYVAALCMGAVLTTIPAAAQVIGTSYTLSPLGARLNFNDKAGLSDGFVYGGEFGFGFGEYLELSGLYVRGTGFETDFDAFPTSILADDVENPGAALVELRALAARDVELQRYGGKLRVNLGGANIVPFITAGTGIIRFDADGLETSENIYVNGGAGLTFSLQDRYTISLAAENLIYRYNPATLLSDADLEQAGLTREGFDQQTVFNPAVSASVKFYLGGRSEGELTDVDRALMRQLRGGGFRLAVEPFYGRIDFHNDLRGRFPKNQDVAGVQAGFDFGPQIGVRGFYWRGVGELDGLDTNFEDAFDDVDFYGGELQLRFAELGGNLTPFVSVGGGYMNIDEDSFVGEAGIVPEDQYFALGGVGVDLPLSSALRVHGGVRGFLTSTQDIEDVSSPDNVYASWMYSAGVSFNLGGSGRSVGDVFGQEMEKSRRDAQTQQEALAVQLAGIRAELDSLKVVRAMSVEAPAADVALTQRAVVAGRDTMRATPLALAKADRSNVTEKTMLVPIPEVGEIYIRFGDVQGRATETVYVPMLTGGIAPMQAMGPPQQATQVTPMPVDTTGAPLSDTRIRQIVGETLDARQPAGMTAAQMENSLRAMEDRLSARFEREQNRLRAEMAAQQRETAVVQGADEPASRSGGLGGAIRERQLVAVQPLIGLRTGEGPEQFLIGVRGDYRFAGRNSRLMPELALAFGDGVALSVFGNMAYPFGGALFPQAQPYVGAGVGFVSDRGLSGLDLAFNLLVGTEYTLANGMTFFGEYSTLDLFDFNRVLLGYRLRF